MFQIPCDTDKKHFNRIEEAVYLVLKMKFFCQEYVAIAIRNLPNSKLVFNIWDSFNKKEVLEEKHQFLQSLGKDVKEAKVKEVIIHDSLGFNVKERRCDMPWKGLVILPNGDVLPCCALTNYVVGNLHYQSIEGILNGEPINKLRELIKNNDYRYCSTLCNVNFHPESNISGLAQAYTPDYLKMFNEGKYKEVIKELKLNQNLENLEPDAIYSYAYSLHMEGNKEEALKYYDLALKKGFEEFWLCYNRGSLYLTMGNYKKAHADLTRAVQLKPDHEGARIVMQQLSELERKHN